MSQLIKYTPRLASRRRTRSQISLSLSHSYGLAWQW